VAESTHLSLHASVHGRVQGVGFRVFVTTSAVAVGLTGRVRNRSDGSVEVVAEGNGAALERLLALLQEGPPMAHVEGVETEWSAASNAFGSFSVGP
jgi:acylphosphatase